MAEKVPTGMSEKNTMDLVVGKIQEVAKALVQTEVMRSTRIQKGAWLYMAVVYWKRK
jgi:hypothetical protein